MPILNVRHRRRSFAFATDFFFGSSSTTSDRWRQRFTAQAVAVASLALIASTLSGCEEPCEVAFDCAVGEVCTEGACVLASEPDVEPEDAPAFPETTLELSTERTQELTVDVTVGCDLEVCSFECKVGNASYRSCESGATLTLPGEGEHVILARAIATESNLVDESPAEAIVVVDQTAPMLTFESVPEEESNSRSGTIEFSCDEACTFTCSLDGAPAIGCQGSFAFAGLNDGPHFIEVVPTDLVDIEGEGARHDWTIDATPPTLTLLSTPPAVGNSDVATVEFECDEVCRVLCSLDGAPAVECQSPYLVTAGEGAHTLTLAATDFFGNDADVATVEWTVDVTAPQTTIDIAPTDGTEAYRVQVGFSCDEAPCTFECRLDGEDFTACSSPIEYVALEPGARAVTVRAIDAAGNVDATPAVTTWTQVRTWTDIAASHHYCAIAGNGSLWCWGDNTRGQVGIGAASDEEVLAPVNVGGDDWLDVANGEFHTCAVKVDGSLWCWGANNFGQLGLGEGEPDFAFPRRVGNANDWVSVWRDGASALHSCALTLTDILCWGRNVDGEVGIGSDADSVSVPSVVDFPQYVPRLSTNLGKTVVGIGVGPVIFFRWGRGMEAVGPANASASAVPSGYGIPGVLHTAFWVCASDGAINFLGPVTPGDHGVKEYLVLNEFMSDTGDDFEFYSLASTPSGVACGPDVVCQIESEGPSAFCNSKPTVALGGPLEAHQDLEISVLGSRTLGSLAIGFTRTLLMATDGALFSLGADSSDNTPVRVP